MNALAKNPFSDEIIRYRDFNLMKVLHLMPFKIRLTSLMIIHTFYFYIFEEGNSFHSLNSLITIRKSIGVRLCPNDNNEEIVKINQMSSTITRRKQNRTLSHILYQSLSERCLINIT